VQKDRKRSFVNPLTQRSDTLSPTLPETSTDTATLPSTEPSTEPSTLPSTETSASASAKPSTEPYTFTSTPRRHRGALAFEKTHERITLWLNKSYKMRLDALAEREGIAKSTLMDEAIRDLLEKYKAWNL